MAEEAIAFRAHARLLTMLGEQLIKNERIALVELVKNSYDADARRVWVDFRGFSDKMVPRPGSRIVITDDGIGMRPEVMKSVWMNPATPTKARAKRRTPRTELGRVIQGEKGIGRFATFKLGSQVTVVSRARGDDREATLLIDITSLDDIEQSTREDDFFLEELSAIMDVAAPSRFDGADPLYESTHGTQIEIQQLRSSWGLDLVKGVAEDVARLEPLMWQRDDTPVQRDFAVTFSQDGVELSLTSQVQQHLQAVLDQAVLKVNGRFDSEGRSFDLTVNDRNLHLPIAGPEITSISAFRDWFQDEDGTFRQPSCGSFEFELFVFDRQSSAPARYNLDPNDKRLLKDHRVYLYRDGIRVYPYGDPDDDWLGIDTIRANRSARSMFSNDQLIGFVSITQEENPDLRDKTNREGLLENGSAVTDFLALLRTLLSYLRSKPYEQYALANRRAKERVNQTRSVDATIAELQRSAEMPSKLQPRLAVLAASLEAERQQAITRLERTEQLAGVGLSVETASHDLIATGDETLRLARMVVDRVRYLDLMSDPIHSLSKTLVARLEFVAARFKDVQGLFVSTKQKMAKHDVLRVVRSVRSMYTELHASKDIEFEIDGDVGLSARTTEAALLQCIINLVDNATYWLMASPEPRRLRAYVDSSDPRTLVVSDNGPGVAESDRDFIFDPFYSGRGEDGRGLGLYIARQNGERSGFSVDLRESSGERDLGGASFTVTFESET